ncbi:MAG: vanadium-dependent haloperoxidase [Chitinophagaceae bacterium]|nr:vanadium-dependent haloperoxidase [Chitinophagaceae bacterium]
MKSVFKLSHARSSLYLVFTFLIFLFSSCQKEKQPLNPEVGLLTADEEGNGHGHLKQTKKFSSDVVVRWLNVQLDMLRVPLAPGTGSQASERALAYCGIALYEAVVQGMPAYRSLCGQLTDFPQMPRTEPGKAYHWAAVANAALADMNRKLFPATSAANKTAIDNLENSLQAIYANEANTKTLQRSIAHGKEVAARVFAWAATDGSANVNPPYVPPVGPGLWVSTAPNFPAAVNPYASQRRLLVPGVAYGTALQPLPPYSEDPSSPFFAMVKDVYDKSQALTPEQTAMAIYHRDAPGYPGGGHFVAVLSQVISKAQPSLDIAALAYAKTGIAISDAVIICFINKYNYNLVRPITYIRNVMGYTTWNALFNTPGHPEFPSAHAVNGAAAAAMLTTVFGRHFQFELHTYDYLGLPARSYNSFYEMGKEMADSRVFGGIHYKASCDKGRELGEKVVQNILRRVRFFKGGGHHGHNGHD